MSEKIQTASKEDLKTSTLTEFINAVTNYAGSNRSFNCYRGQKKSDWNNIPGLFRPDLSSLEENEKRAIRDLISVHPHEFSADQTMFDRLFRMQHFGLPTRLMDVSQNPLVALYFATDLDADGSVSDGAVTAFSVPPEREKYYDSDSVSCIANLANMTKEEKSSIIELFQDIIDGKEGVANNIDDINNNEVIKRLNQFIKSEKPYFLPILELFDLFKPYYVHPKMSNRRILSQAGGFIIHGLMPPLQIIYTNEIKETKFVIPLESKKSLRSDLELLGVNESTLFPELDKAAKRIQSNYTRK